MIKLDDAYDNLLNNRYSSNEVSLFTPENIVSISVTLFFSSYHPLWWQFPCLTKLVVMTKICD